MSPKPAFIACKDCQARTVGCHSTCEKYLTEKAEHKRKNDEILKARNDEDILDDFKTRTVLATKKRYGRR